MGRIGGLKMVRTESPIFQELLNTVDDPFLILNTSCQIESLNDKAAQLLKIKRGTQPLLQLDEQSIQHWNLFLAKIREEFGGYCTLNVSLENQIQEIKLMGYYNEHHNLICARIIPHKQANLDQIYSILNDITHGIMITDMNGKVIEINEEATQLIQCERNEIINNLHEKIFDKFLNGESKLKYFTDLINNGRATIQVIKKNQLDERTYIKMESKINYEMHLLITTLTDETEKTQLMQKIDHQNSLNTLGQMAASIAHEIRNPMTSLKGFVDLLKHSSSDDGQRYISVIDSELQRMETILTEFLYLSKPVQRESKNFSISEVIEDVVELMKPHAQLYNVNLIFENYELYKTNIIGNDNRIKQMLINLVKNAIEVMQNGGRIIITLKKSQNGNLQISVKDEGYGISERELKNLFKPFYTTKTAGTGLGLALVKKVIEEHKGTIYVESIVEKGTTFFIELPTNYEKHYYCENKEHSLNMTMIH